MGKLYSVGEVAEMANVTAETIRTWEINKTIPQSDRVGLGRIRMWSEWKLERILEFASGNGHRVTLPSECY